MRRGSLFGLLLLVAVALVLRGGDLSLRPLHNDEAINAFKLRQLWSQGEYRYDPDEFHGPTLYYLSLPILRVVQWFHPDQPDEIGMRWVTVLFGIALILALYWLADGLGRGATLAAGWFTALSPAFVYYSRYFIHETLLIFFTALALGALWRYLRRPGFGWAAVFGASVGAMYATKETFVFAMAAMGAAWLGTRAWLGPVPASASANANQTLLQVERSSGRGMSWRRHLPAAGVAVLAGIIVAFVFFTSFLAHPEAAPDAVRTYFIWLHRAGGASPHIHPWSFYFERLLWFRPRSSPVWSEAAVLALALVGIAGLFRRPRSDEDPARRWLTAFLTLYAVVLAAIYCLIPYKTPWCLLGFHHGFVLLAGIGAVTLITLDRRPVWRGAMGVVLAVVSVQLTVQSWRANRDFAADFRNPYVYAHTSADLFNLLEQVHEVAASHPAGYGMPINVMAPESEYWPLPWYLRRFGEVGWWDRVPEQPFTPVIIAASKLGASLEERSRSAWRMVGFFELRPRFFVELYVESQLWDRFLAARAARRAAGGE